MPLSDDSIREILSYLTGQEVISLITTGSKGLIKRLMWNTTKLVFNFNESTYFPTVAYRFPNLESLIINSSIGSASNHLSTKGLDVLPRRPMKSLKSLNVNFATSVRFLGPRPDGNTMSTLFPNLTSLEVQSSMHLAGLGVQAVPEQGIGSVAQLLGIPIGTNVLSRCIPSSWLDHLPIGIQNLRIDVAHAQTIVEKVDLRRYKNLRTVHIKSLMYPSLPLLPDSIEELHLTFLWNRLALTVSKFPPNIRVWNIYGSTIRFELDCMAPHTLEEVSFLCQDHYTELENVKQFFVLSSLKKFSMNGSSLPIDLVDQTPRIESFLVASNIDASQAIARLPDCITTLEISSNLAPPDAPTWPSALRTLTMTVSNVDNILNLPQTLTSLRLNYSNLRNIPSAVWSTLPPQLRVMKVDMILFKTSKGLHALPETLEELCMTASIPSHYTGLSFSDSLSRSLKILEMRCYPEYTGQTSLGYAGSEFLRKIENFAKLEVLNIQFPVPPNSPMLRYDTLAKLPKTLTDLQLDGAFVDYGLPTGASFSSDTDLSHGLLSRLPKDLKRLVLYIHTDQGVSINSKLFSRLPKGLAVLKLACAVDSLESLISVLPKRIASLDVFHDPLDLMELVFGVSRQQQIQKYYDSNKFWDGLKTISDPLPWGTDLQGIP